ncbi:phosphorylase superfamily protein [Trichoderma harzianum]|uniref:Phosphorylase superfamily protein n=1 Tax=Trichoderma harzianum TaxID=5544 RepID=A0A0F9XGF4_TRIHA|nr:phosphorylase superfamily protein [Trichoderma harzianum]
MSNGTGPTQPIRRSDFKIAIICALQVEYDAVCLLVDEFWDEDFGRAEGDQNFYTAGCVGNHNVVIILLESMGKISAAKAVANMRVSFTAIQLLLLVGICGGVPSGPRGEILLGDVIIGDEVKLYDYGKRYPDGFRRSEDPGYNISNFNRGVRGLLGAIQTDRGMRSFEDRISHHLQHLQEVASSQKIIKYSYPGSEEDKLFASEYRHKHHQRAPCICRRCLTDSDPICEEAIKASCLETNCDTNHIILRERIAVKQMLGPERVNEAQRPTVHFACLASADMVLKSAKDRDALSQELQVIGFEMEAAGFYNELPYVVIKSVCDYADSHKSKAWQPFAAATAASACKSLLERYHRTDSIPQEAFIDHGASKEDCPHAAICVIPLLKNERFVGRQDVLEKLKEMLFHKQSFSRAALVGLGGMGKTQVALQLAYLMKDVLRDEGGRECSVLWIPALSVATFEQACADIARRIPQSSRWLLILDNADDHDLIFGHSSAPGGLLQYLPRSDLGCILATTRDRGVAVGFAETNVVMLSEMGMDEAETFSRKSLIENGFVGVGEDIKSLLEFLERTPLAIAQAVAYINVNQVTIREFLSLLQGVPYDQISILSRHFRDSTRYQESQNAIALTWLASFDRITQTDPVAAKLLAFISYIEPKDIPRSLLPEGESREEFLRGIGTLLGYGFLTLQREDFYDMHRLVHIAATVWARERFTDTMNPNLALENVASRLLGSPIQQPFDNDSSLILACRVGQCMMVEGMTQLAVSMLEGLVAYTDMRGDKDSTCQSPQHELARAYYYDRQYEKAESILERVVAVREEVLGEEHEETIRSQEVLAKVYRELGKYKEAILILERVVAVRKKTLGEEHQETIGSQHALAKAYRLDGRFNEAKLMLEHVVALRERTFGEDHPFLLVSQFELAKVYKQGDQMDNTKAFSILERLVVRGMRTNSMEDPFYLSSLHELAGLHYANDETDKAVLLLEYVVAMHRKILPEDDYRRVRSEKNLMQMYRSLETRAQHRDGGMQQAADSGRI